VRRRITFSLCLVVMGALVVAGVGTLVLARGSERRTNRQQLEVQARGIARAGDAVARPGVFAVFVESLRLDDATVIFVNAQSRIIDPGSLPSGVPAARIDLAALQAGTVTSGNRGRTVFAVAPMDLNRLRAAVAAAAAAGTATPVTTTTPAGRVARRRSLAVPAGATSAAVVISRRLPAGSGVAGGYFLVAAGLALLVAVGVGDRLGRRITRPLLAAEAATRRIALGDLTARVPVEPKEVPELVSLAYSVNTMAEALAASKGLERQFLLSVSHDLRTPLTSIQGFAEAIADGAAADHEHAAGIIAAEARRLERLVGDLLLLAKLDARRFSMDLRPTDLAEVAGETAGGFGPKAGELGLTLDVAPPSPLPLVLADPDRLAQVTANLVENALNFATARVVVAVEPVPGGAALVVADDGPGIAPVDLPHVFERLYQSSGRVSTRQVGSGLGLAIVAELVTAMGGTVHAEATPGGGTRMVVRVRAAPTGAWTSRSSLAPTSWS
jgi:two-component system sensor histidine kinase BaeS